MMQAAGLFSSPLNFEAARAASDGLMHADHSWPLVWNYTKQVWNMGTAWGCVYSIVIYSYPKTHIRDLIS